METRVLDLLPPPDRLPLPGNPDRADLGFQNLAEATASLDDPELSRFARELRGDAAGRALLAAIFGNSPFLSQCLLREIGTLSQVLSQGPDAALRTTFAAARTVADDLAGVKRNLRIAKRRVALIAGVADIAGLWPLESVTGALTDFADLALDTAAARLLLDAAAQGEIVLADPEAPLSGSGLIVIAMGKMGARELNYSSDIDLIVLYDDERIRYTGRRSLQEFMVRLTRTLMPALEERTGDGYVFRTDLRLRPDPASTPPALSVLAAETYYESLGQNWERAAMIKARAAAGDREAGQRFLRNLVPFVWRRSLDFAAIRDIHSIKRQINAHRGGGAITVAGHNIKVGRGGIREVEFFAQTQQLIFGGRDPSLRAAGTLDALAALTRAGRVDPAVCEEMSQSYRFLRTLEHRLQMIEDRQTQTLPKSDAELRELALFMGYPDTEPFTADLIGHLRRVETHYAELFEDEPSLSGPGNLVFTGGEDDPGTIQTLTELGYTNPSAIAATVRGWHHGRHRATRTTRAREILTELMPHLLAALARSANPDGAFLNFDAFLSRLPSGVQLFSLFHSNPGLLDLVAEIMGSAPRLAEHLSRYPVVLDSVLASDFFDPPPAAAALADELDRMLAQARDFQDRLDMARRFANDHKFQVGVQTLRGMLDATQAGAALADIADVALARMLDAAERDLAERHGRFPGDPEGTGMAVLALGKLGSREMTPTSDLDLIFVYDVPEGVEASDGEKPLSPPHYFARLGQKLLSAITAPTGEGKLYDVDMRLRPSGSAGPAASSLEAFVRYHAESAWTWEHMALTRARVVAGPPRLRARIEAAVRDVLTAERDAAKLARDVADMRARIAREKAPSGAWDVKLIRGGMIDVEFIAQYLQLRHAHEHPAILRTATTEAIRAAETAGVLRLDDAEALEAAARLWLSVQGMLRLTISGAFDENSAPEGLKAPLAKAAGAVDFAALKQQMTECAERVRALFARLIEEPAGARDQTQSPESSG